MPARESPAAHPAAGPARIAELTLRIAERANRLAQERGMAPGCELDPVPDGPERVFTYFDEDGAEHECVVVETSSAENKDPAETGLLPV